ncbi:hypothetical protein protein [Bacillus cereus G9241]|nr:hypothetical protein protein [Bacillus cereus G9241]
MLQLFLYSSAVAYLVQLREPPSIPLDLRKQLHLHVLRLKMQHTLLSLQLYHCGTSRSLLRILLHHFHVQHSQLVSHLHVKIPLLNVNQTFAHRSLPHLLLLSQEVRYPPLLLALLTIQVSSYLGHPLFLLTATPSPIGKIVVSYPSWFISHSLYVLIRRIKPRVRLFSIFSLVVTRPWYITLSEIITPPGFNNGSYKSKKRRYCPFAASIKITSNVPCSSTCSPVSNASP